MQSLCIAYYYYYYCASLAKWLNGNWYSSSSSTGNYLVPICDDGNKMQETTTERPEKIRRGHSWSVHPRDSDNQIDDDAPI